MTALTSASEEAIKNRILELSDVEAKPVAVDVREELNPDGDVVVVTVSYQTSDPTAEAPDQTALYALSRSSRRIVTDVLGPDQEVRLLYSHPDVD